MAHKYIQGQLIFDKGIKVIEEKIGSLFKRMMLGNLDILMFKNVDSYLVLYTKKIINLNVKPETIKLRESDIFWYDTKAQPIKETVNLDLIKMYFRVHWNG